MCRIRKFLKQLEMILKYMKLKYIEIIIKYK